MIWTYKIQIGCQVIHGITHIFVRNYMKLFQGFIINARTDRYNIVCYTDAYERDNQSYSCDYGISSEGFPLPTTSTTEALEQPQNIISQNAVVCILIILNNCVIKSQLKSPISTVQRKNANHYYMLSEVVGMCTNQDRSYHH